MNSNQYKITIEATQTFSPGNVELLIYLLKKIDSENFKITLYLGHESTYRLVSDLRISSLKIIKSSVFQTFIRSLRKRSNVLFFCSYPPLSKHNNSIVYYHSSFFFSPIKILKNRNISYKTKLSRVFVHWIIRLFHTNVDVFYCQTQEVKNELLQNFNNIHVVCKPFFNDLDLIEAKNIEKNREKCKTNDADFDKLYQEVQDCIVSQKECLAEVYKNEILKEIERERQAK